MSNNSGPVALVTGSSKGIGRSIAETLAAKGYRVIVTSRGADAANEAAAQISQGGAEVTGIQFDIDDESSVRDLIANTHAKWGRLDVLVNNSPSAQLVLPAVNIEYQTLQTAITNGFTNTFFVTLQAFDLLKKSGGCVINIASSVTRRHLMGLAIYRIAKGALVEMTKTLAAEWASAGVRVNAINPGFIRTTAFSSMGMDDATIEKSYAFYDSYQPLGGVGKPEAIAEATAYLASKSAAMITGTILDVDGGYSVNGLPLYSQ